MSSPMVLKSELVSSRSALSSNQANVDDALLSLDLEGIVDLMDPNRSQFTVMELLGYRLVGFPAVFDGGTSTVNQNRPMLFHVNALTATTNIHVLGYESVFLDTSVPDASQPTTVDTAADTDERWLASATNIVADGRDVWLRQTASDQVFWKERIGRNYWKDWVDLQDEKGRGVLVASPRLIVRLSRVMDSDTAGALDTAGLNQNFQIRLRYRTKKISKTQMWQMLLQQTPGETLIRSGAAAFP